MHETGLALNYLLFTFLLQGFEDVKGLEDKIKSMQLEEKELPQTKLVESNLDTVMAARLASAEAIANALTEAATSAATGEVDGSDAGKSG